MPRRSGCESCFSSLVVIGLSVALIYWDCEGFRRLERGLDWNHWVRQIWGIGMRMTVTVVWFSFPALILMVLAGSERGAGFIGRSLIFTTGPNLLLWNIMGSAVQAINPSSLCHKGEACQGLMPVLLCGLVWAFLYMLSFVSTYVGWKLFRSYRPVPTPPRVSTASRWEIVKDSSMKQLLIHKNTNEICSICLDKFKKGESVQQLSACKHQFHEVCLRSWLGYSATCPVCRSGVE